ncbi:MAG: hypothetical protein ACRDDX_10980 [Cellulosilyticaceae bacterium]
MNEQQLDKLLGELGDVEVKASATLVTLARRQVEERQEKKAFLKENAPVVLGVIMSTILTLVSGCIGFLFVRDTKAVVTLTLALLGMTQVPILIFLMTTIYCKEKKNQEEIEKE